MHGFVLDCPPLKKNNTTLKMLRNVYAIVTFVRYAHLQPSYIYILEDMYKGKSGCSSTTI